MTGIIQAAIIVTCLLGVFWTGFFLGFIVNRPRRNFGPAITKPFTMSGNEADREAQLSGIKAELRKQTAQKQEGIVNEVLRSFNRD